MSTVKFKVPNLGKLVSSNKKLDNNAPQKMIHVLNGYAVVSNEIIAIVNLREYVKHECSIKNEDDLKKLTRIIEWMEGKAFTKSFWDELKTQCFVEVIPDGLEIQNISYNKHLIWENLFTQSNLMMETIKDNLSREPKTVDMIAVRGSAYSLLHNAFGAEMKNDSWVFDFSGKQHAMRFSGSSKDYIFGLIPLMYKEATEFTAFINSKEFAGWLSEMF